MRTLLADLPVDWFTLADFPPLPPPEEHGRTFAENAADKAMYYARALGVWALADDSGLEVDALQGAPGIHSARYAGSQGDDTANNRKLMEQLRHVSLDRRGAQFRCAVALANGATVVAAAEGSVRGVVIDEPRGANGFGYDPHFCLPDFGKTAAELSFELKNLVSHRGRALRALRPAILRAVLRESGFSLPEPP